MAKSSASKKTQQVGKAKSASEDGGQSKAAAAKLKKLKVENLALRKAAAAKENLGSMIPRPPKGIAGNGFNLRSAMGLEDNPELFRSLRRTVRAATAMAGLDFRVKWAHQPKPAIAQIIGVARERQPYLRQFPGGWPVEEIMKCSFKNKRAYARKVGDLAEVTNFNNVEDDMDGDQEDDGDGEDQYDDAMKDETDGEQSEWGGIATD